MKINEIFDAFEEIGCCTFTTIDRGFPVSRIAHFIAYDQEGLYFSTMNTKPFYKQLTENDGKISVCGMNCSTHVTKIDEENISFAPGFFIRISGTAEEVPTSTLIQKNNPIFNYFLADQTRYPAMVSFKITDFSGEVYDYDFEKENRDHKLERNRFSFGHSTTIPSGFEIQDHCINCGKCVKKCSFSALETGEHKPTQLGNRCDECGDCVIVCPVNAIVHKGI